MNMKTKAISGVMITLFLTSAFLIGFNMITVFHPASSSVMALNVPEDFATIQEAIDAANYGDVVRVSAGFYEESIVMKDGVSVIGAGSDVTTIQWHGRVVYGASDATIRGFKITGNNKGNIGIYATGVSKFCIIDNVITNFNGTRDKSARGISIVNSEFVNICINEISYIFDNLWSDSRGIDVIDSNSMLIYGNRIFEITDEEWESVFGIHASNFDDSAVVGNLIYGINDTLWGSSYGVYVKGESTTIEYNTIALVNETAWDNSFGIRNVGFNTVINNIVFDVTAYLWGGLYSAYGIHNDVGTIDYNNIYKVDGPLIYGPYGTNNIFEDPKFVDVDARDFHLQEGSPCLTASDTGGEIGAYGAPILCEIPVTIDIDPDTLNLKSKGNWVTCYIELPEGGSLEDIDRSTLLLEGLIPVDPKWIEKPLDSVIGDYDSDGIPDLMVKFDRQALIDYLKGKDVADGDDVTLTVTGEIAGTAFVGTDTIRVLNKEKT